MPLIKSTCQFKSTDKIGKDKVGRIFINPQYVISVYGEGLEEDTIFVCMNGSGHGPRDGYVVYETMDSFYAKYEEAMCGHHPSVYVQAGEAEDEE